MISKNNSVRIDYEKATRLVKAIMSRKDDISKFRHPETFPDGIIPENIDKGGLEHSLYLFHAISIDSMRQSNVVYKAMRGVLTRLKGFQDLPYKKSGKLKTHCILISGAEYSIQKVQ